MLKAGAVGYRSLVLLLRKKIPFLSSLEHFRENRETLEAQSRSTGVEDRQSQIKNSSVNP
jgi:hypothetical protein